MRRGGAILIGGALVTALAGCAGGGSPDDVRLPPAASPADTPDCLAPNLAYFRDGFASPPAGGADAPDAGGVPDDFTATEAVLCSLSFDSGKADPDAGAGQDVGIVIREEWLTGDLSDLTDALRQPNDPPAEMCTADMEIVPELWLVDEAGRAVRVEWPRDGCRKTKKPAHAALAQLERLALVEHPLPA